MLASELEIVGTHVDPALGPVSCAVLQDSAATESLLWTACGGRKTLQTHTLWPETAERGKYLDHAAT